ncbi:phosphatidate cytidylyltransferase [candidate division KSB1 bacterium]
MNLTWNSNLRNRVTVGLLGGPAILFCAFYGGYLFLAFTLLIGFVSIYEMRLMGKAIGYQVIDISSYLFCAAVFFDSYFFQMDHLYLLTLIYMVVILLEALVSDKENKLHELSYKFISASYIVFFLAPLILMRELDYQNGYGEGGKVVAVIFLGIWFLDTLAYFGGKIFGRHKLVPRISPKKTVEGSIAGIIGCLIAVFAARAVFYPEMNWDNALALAIIIGVTGQIGDMIESFFKRKTGIKDSSSILPGHGGILDRFDSLIFIAPFAYLYVKWMVALP